MSPLLNSKIPTLWTLLTSSLFLVVTPLALVVATISILVFPFALSQVIEHRPIVHASIRVDDLAFPEVVLHPSADQGDAFLQFEGAFSMFLVIFPVTHVLSLVGFVGAESMPVIFVPLSIILFIIRVVVEAFPMLLAFFPLPTVELAIGDQGVDDHTFPLEQSPLKLAMIL